MQPIYEGKAKRLWTTDNPSTLRMEFKNDATAFNGEKKASFENKGRLNNAISTLIYQYLEKSGIPTTLRDTRGKEIDGACGQLAATE
jgi:phosphoribosylaminoimidazole-succinocarboxamide synthase